MMIELFAAAALLTKQWTLANGAKAFAATIGPQCLKSEAGTIDADGPVVTVTDEKDCAAEIEEIAKNWEIFAATDVIVTVTGSPEALVEKRRALEAKLGKSPNPRLRFLAATQHCRCLVFAGKLSLEASKLVQGDAKPKDERRAKVDLDGNRIDPLHKQDLIWRDTPGRLSPDAPLVN